MFWKKKVRENKPGHVILGMIMLQGEASFDIQAFANDFEAHYHSTITDLAVACPLVFEVDGLTTAVAHMPVPVPAGDIEGTARYAYNWPSAIRDLRDHKTHLIVTILGEQPDRIKAYKLFTNVISSLLRVTDSVGVYKGNQSLLIPKADYLEESALMSDDYLPLNLWIYFGLSVKDDHHFGYTLGLSEFGKLELEIVDSSKSLDDIRGLLFNIAHYVLDYNVTFRNGQTIGVTEDDKLRISVSKGRFVAGMSVKLAY